MANNNYGWQHGKDGSLGYKWNNGNYWQKSADKSTMVVKTGPWEKTIVNGKVVSTTYTYADGRKITNRHK